MTSEHNGDHKTITANDGKIYVIMCLECNYQEDES